MYKYMYYIIYVVNVTCKHRYWVVLYMCIGNVVCKIFRVYTCNNNNTIAIQGVPFQLKLN